MVKCESLIIISAVKNGVSISFHKLHDWPLVLTKTDDVNQKQMDPTVTHLDHSVLKTSIWLDGTGQTVT